MQERAMKRIGLVIGLMLALAYSALAIAQTPVLPGFQIDSTQNGVIEHHWQPVTSATPLPVTGGGQGFAATPAYATPLSVTNASGTVALPTGAVIAVYNVGASVAYTTVGTAPTATTAMDVIQPGGCFAYTRGSATTLAAITGGTDTTTLNLSGGSSAPLSCGGGGSSSSGGGIVTQGAQDATAAPWQMVLYQGGSLVGAANGLYMRPGTSTTWTVDTTGTGNLDTEIKSPLAAQSAAAVPTGGGVICDAASTANPCAPAANVKAASTAAAAADKGLVVSLSPNNAALSAFNVTPTDCSVTLTSGTVAQNAFTAGATKHGFTVANIDTTHSEPVWISFTTTAAAGAVQSYPLASPTATTYAGLSSYTSPPGFGVNTALSVVAATTGHLISCTWW
jgi:hypothetical protein